MNNYSYSEIQNMQKKAMERVREMQKNSEAVLETARQDLSEKTVEPKKENPPKEPQIKPKITNLPPNFPDFKEYFNMQSEPKVTAPEKEKPQTPPQPQYSQGNIMDLISSEPDRALLLGLLLLLKSEGADETLMMALMYIMA
mgnify:FL=1